MNIFHRASIRLTIIYLVIIMAISLLFSVVIYRLASEEIERGLRRPVGITQIITLNEVLGWEDFIESQEKSIEDAKQNLKINLMIINAFILAGGGVLSYFLARRSLRPIEESHESQRRFTSDASHELRTPIAAMRLENELALTDPKLTVKEAKAQLESNIEELDKLTTLTESLLRLSRLEESEIETSHVDISNVIQVAVERNQKEIEEKKQKITWKKQALKINTNAETLTVAVATLINNASKYSANNSVIEIRCRADKQSVVIEVMDEGVGIAPTDIDRVFERFYRADLSRTKNDANGYGIGLSIAKHSVEKLGGSVTVKSTVSKGSTFTITLPRF